MSGNSISGAVVVAVVGSITTAQKAQRSLASAAIRSEIVKQDASGSRGCSYGVAFPASHRGNVRAILSAAHINVRQYIDGL